MKFIFGIIFILIFQFCYGQENDFIGKYICTHKDEFIEIISDSLIEFNVDYPSCLAIPLYGYGEYKIKRGRLFTQTSESSIPKPNTEIFFRISKDNNDEMSLIGPYFRKNLEYRKEMLKLKLHRMKLLLPWKWNFKHCPIDPNIYKKIKFEHITKCVISYNGDSTLLIEKYEIDIKKKKVFYITPIMNYLDIKGEKYRTPFKIKKQKWGEIQMSTKRLYNFTPLIKDKQTNDSIIYSVDFYNSSESIKGFVFYNETIPLDLKRLFDIIRNND